MPARPPLDLGGAAGQPAPVARRHERDLRLAEDAEGGWPAAEPAGALEQALDAAVAALGARGHQRDAGGELLSLAAVFVSFASSSFTSSSSFT